MKKYISIDILHCGFFLFVCLRETTIQEIIPVLFKYLMYI